MTRDQLADELLELRRYVRTHPEHVKERLRPLAVMILGDAPIYYSRLLANVGVGLRFIQVDPEVLEGYLYAAAFELRLGREKEAEA